MHNDDGKKRIWATLVVAFVILLAVVSCGSARACDDYNGTAVVSKLATVDGVQVPTVMKVARLAGRNPGELASTLTTWAYGVAGDEPEAFIIQMSVICTEGGE